MLEVVRAARELLQHFCAAVESNHLAEVGRPKLSNEADRGILRDLHAVFHARARVDQQREGDRQIAAVEQHQVLLDAIFEDLEILFSQVRHVSGRRIGHGDAHRHDVDGRSKRGLSGGLWLLGSCQQRCSEGCRQREKNQRAKLHRFQRQYTKNPCKSRICVS